MEKPEEQQGAEPADKQSDPLAPRPTVARLSPEQYRQLQIVARSYMRRERRGHTFQPTALLNEALARLFDSPQQFEDRQHFHATCARQMRHILVDHAKARIRIKRGGPDRMQVDDVLNLAIEPVDNASLVELDDLLSQFEQVDAESATAFELHYFGGLTLPETAEALSLSEATVQRRLRLAKAWFLARM
jgi:RNA polymerase sigma factor (TIGR02999 family)